MKKIILIGLLVILVLNVFAYSWNKRLQKVQLNDGSIVLYYDTFNITSFQVKSEINSILFGMYGSEKTSFINIYNKSIDSELADQINGVYSFRKYLKIIKLIYFDY